MRRLGAVLAVAAMCGCGGGGDAAGPTTVATASEVGTYVLVTLNGRSLPTTIPEAGTSIEVISGSLTLAADRTVRVSTTYRSAAGAAASTSEVSGTYSLQGSTLTFSYSNGGRNTATLSGATLQMLNEGVTWLYQKS